MKFLLEILEKIEVRRMHKVATTGFVSVYNHFDKRLGVLIEGSVARAKRCSKNCNPRYFYANRCNESIIH